jgi:hypothetical protein
MFGRTSLLIAGAALAFMFVAPHAKAQTEQASKSVASCPVGILRDAPVAKHPDDAWSIALYNELLGVNKAEHPFGMYDRVVDILRRAGSLPTYSGPLPESLRHATQHAPCAFRFSKEIVDGRAVYYAVLVRPRPEIRYPDAWIEIEVHSDLGRVFGELDTGFPLELVPPEAKAAP